jgi:hypothetical protein
VKKYKLKLISIVSLALLSLLTFTAAGNAAIPKYQSSVGSICTGPPANPICPGTFTLLLQQFPDGRAGRTQLAATINYSCEELSPAAVGACSQIATASGCQGMPLCARSLDLYLDGKPIRTTNVQTLNSVLEASGMCCAWPDGVRGAWGSPGVGYSQWWESQYSMGSLRLPQKPGWHRLQISMAADWTLDAFTIDAYSPVVWFYVR